MKRIVLILVVLALTGCGLYKPSVDMENLSVSKIKLTEDGKITYYIEDQNGNGFTYITIKDNLQVGDYVRLEKYRHKY